jgi:hypothetical protein
MSTTVPGTLRCTNSTVSYRLNPSIAPEYVLTLNNLCQENGWELDVTYERSGPQDDETWTAVVLSKTSIKYLHPLLK